MQKASFLAFSRLTRPVPIRGLRSTEISELGALISTHGLVDGVFVHGFAVKMIIDRGAKIPIMFAETKLPSCKVEAVTSIRGVTVGLGTVGINLGDF